MNTSSITLSVLGVTVGLFVLGWVATANDWAMSAYWSPKYEQVRYNTFKSSQAYNDGMVQEFDTARRDYAHATTVEEKHAIRSLILHRYAAYNSNNLPYEDAVFLSQLRNQP